MKKKIEDALRTEYAGLGLSDKTIGRLADFVLGSVQNEEDIVTAVKGDAVKLIAKSIQGEIDGLKRAKETAEAALEDYKAKHPEGQKTEGGDGNININWQATLAQAIKDAVAPLAEEIATLKSSTSAKEALSSAKDRFFGGEYAKKYGDQAADAWDRAVELNEATGSKMSADELVEKASGYFNKSVSRLGVDTSKPFQADPPKGEDEGTLDWSSEKKRLQDAGRLPQ